MCASNSVVSTLIQVTGAALVQACPNYTTLCVNRYLQAHLLLRKVIGYCI